MFERIGRTVAALGTAALSGLVLSAAAMAVQQAEPDTADTEAAAEEAAPAQGGARTVGTTPLDLAIRSARMTVEGRRMIERAFLDSTLYLAIRPDEAGGGQFVTGRQNGRVAFQAFDTPERLEAWVAVSVPDPTGLAQFSGPARELLSLLDRQTRGNVYLNVNSMYAYPLAIDPDLFRYLAVRATLPEPDTAATPMQGAPQTPMEVQLSLQATDTPESMVWERNLLRLFAGQIFYVTLMPGEEGARYTFAPEPAESEDAPARLAVFDRYPLAEAYAEDYEARHGVEVRYQPMRGRQLMQALPAGVELDFNTGSANAAPLPADLVDRLRPRQPEAAGDTAE
jgi:hypothetical protein